MFGRLGHAIKHLGQKAIHGASHIIERAKHIGHKVHETVKRVPLVGQHLADGLEYVYNNGLGPIPSGKSIMNKAEAVVHIGKKLLGDDPEQKQEAMNKIKHLGQKAGQGDYGRFAKSTYDTGKAAVDRIAGVLA